MLESAHFVKTAHHPIGSGTRSAAPAPAGLCDLPGTAGRGHGERRYRMYAIGKTKSVKRSELDNPPITTTPKA